LVPAFNGSSVLGLPFCGASAGSGNSNDAKLCTVIFALQAALIQMTTQLSSKTEIQGTSFQKARTSP
jgi:hypothetical protein